MAINIGAAQISGFYIGGSAISAASMGAAANKIWPAELVFSSSGGGSASDIYDIPAGTLDYYCYLGGSAGHVRILNNNVEIVDQYTMSEDISGTEPVSAGTLTIEIDGDNWSYELRIS